MPGFDTFRVPARWLFLWEFGVAILAGGRVPTGSPAGRASSGGGPQLWPRVLAGGRDPGRRPGLAARRGRGLRPRVGPRWRSPAIAAGDPGGGRAASPGAPVAGGQLLLAGLTGVELWAAADASPARQAPPPAFTAGRDGGLAASAHGVTDQERLLSLARPGVRAGRRRRHPCARSSGYVAEPGDRSRSWSPRSGTIRSRRMCHFSSGSTRRMATTVASCRCCAGST